MAHDGERLAVTNRGVVVARLVPPDSAAETAEETLQRLARAGKVRLPPPNARPAYSRLPKERRLPDEVVEALLDEVRGDR